MSAGAFAYSTVFRSRLGALNLALQSSDRSFATRARLKRNLENRLKVTKRVTASDAVWLGLLAYLVEKGFVSKSKEWKSKYKYRYEKEASGLIQLYDQKSALVTEGNFSIADIWLSDDRVRSTSGAPTVENADEIIDLAFQMEVISAAKGNWTGVGKLAADLRDGAPEAIQGNPYLLDREMLVFIRALFEHDGWMLRELGTRLGGLSPEFSREDAISVFGDATDAVVARAKASVKDRESISKFDEFGTLVRENMAKRAQKVPKDQINLGVLEHRVSPRLEWLTDMRVLEKEQKNAFFYKWGMEREAFERALGLVDNSVQSRDGAALCFLLQSSWATRELGELREPDPRRAVMKAYALVRPSVGPARIDDVAFLVGVFVRDRQNNLAHWREYVVSLAREIEGVTVSGDRYTRSPRLIHMKERVWKG